MLEEKPKKYKMKIAGYICIIFAMILSAIMLIPYFKVDIEVALPLVKFWASIMGLGLLFGTAVKRIGGAAVQNKKEGQS